MHKFTVDTHLFRELGELLVGRDSTALVELIKNAYDADATVVTVHGEQLNNPTRGRIVVADNGTGMGIDEFEAGFLRIASRLKDQEDRHSRLLRRRYTGAKGIGRLAAHKLAKKLEINSVPHVQGQNRSRSALYAAIDWDEIERYETLDDIDSTDAVFVEPKTVRANAASGTTIVLSRLRRAWTPSERARFLAEVQSFEPPVFLKEPLPRFMISKPLLFDAPVVRDESTHGSTSSFGFQVHLEGDFAVGEDYWALVADMAAWVLEIRTDPLSREVRFAITPTNKTRDNNLEARYFEHSIPHPTPEDGPHFDARILVREGRLSGSRDQRVWAARTSGIRVYLEGFRILPYGEQSNDWLSIDADYTRRPRQLEMLEDLRLRADEVDPDEGLIRVPSNNYFGAIFLTQDHSSGLRVLVNREGFVPDASFDTLVQLVRTGIDLCTRVRAAAAYARRETRKRERSQKQDTNKNDSEGIALPDRLRQVAQVLDNAREHFNEGDIGKGNDLAGTAVRDLAETTELATDMVSERSLLLVLASVGTQMAAFVHEINSFLGTAQTIEHALVQVLDQVDLSRDLERKLNTVFSVLVELRRGLERQSAYLMDIETPDARRRRSRQRFVERFNTATRILRHHAERRGIHIDNRIPSGLRSPPMFPAELSAIFVNLMTNAVKAAGDTGRIQATGSSESARIQIRIENTGVAVMPTEAERWFKPFESTTLEVDPILGQGMGLGLTITRKILENYGATVTFVPPNRQFATAVEITFPSNNRD